MFLRGIRGAITTEGNTKPSILSATTDLINTILDRNEIDVTDIASIFFSVTKDLNAAFPAQAARDMGLTGTPLLCLNEIDVPGGLAHCIRVLVHVNTTKAQAEVSHVYLREATKLRPDQSSDEGPS